MTNQEVNFGLDAIQAIGYNPAKEILQHIKYAILDNEKVCKYLENVYFEGTKFKHFKITKIKEVPVLRYCDDVEEYNHERIDSFISEEDSEENARVIKLILLRLRTLYLLVHQEEALNLAVRFILDLPVIP